MTIFTIGSDLEGLLCNYVVNAAPFLACGCAAGTEAAVAHQAFARLVRAVDVSRSSLDGINPLTAAPASASRTSLTFSVFAAVSSLACRFYSSLLTLELHLCAGPHFAHEPNGDLN